MSTALEILNRYPTLQSIYMLRSNVFGVYQPPTEEEAASFLLWMAVFGRRIYHGIVIDADFFAFLSNPLGRFLTRLELSAASIGQTSALPIEDIHHWYYEIGVKEFNLGPYVTGKEIDAYRAWTRRSPEVARDAVLTRSRDGNNKESRLTLGVNLIGYAEGVLGIGEDLRSLASVLGSAGIPHCVYNVPLSSHHSTEEQVALDPLIVDRPLFPVNVFCMTLFETERMRCEVGDRLFAGRYNIGYWPWELSAVPECWRHAFEGVDEVWAMSRFLVEVYSASTDKPVHFIPPYVHVEVEPYDRGGLDISSSDFLFLCILDFNSYISRKNPIGAIRAFRAAFPDISSDERLLLKTINGRNQPDRFDEIRRQIGNDERIIIVDGAMPRPQLCGLIADADCLVSLHRSEGFGRVIAEAMDVGTPVIATDYSGSASFLDESSGFLVDYQLVDVRRGEYLFEEGSQWADPLLESAVRQFQLVRNRRDMAKRKISKAKTQIKKLHGRVAVQEALRGRLAEIQLELGTRSGRR